MISDDDNTCFFIINVNIHSFRFMNKMQSIDSYFLNIIDVEPFSAEELRDIILFRHRSTALKFELKGSIEDELSPWGQARLFARYFNYSRGNVGVALQAWISNITKFEDGKLTIKKPAFRHAPELKFLNPDWMLLIVQFVLHRRLTIERLNRITKVNTTDLQKQVNTLIRAGVLAARPSSPPPAPPKGGESASAQDSQGESVSDVQQSAVAEADITEARHTINPQYQTTDPALAGLEQQQVPPGNQGEAEDRATDIVFELNPFIRPLLVNELVDKGVL